MPIRLRRLDNRAASIAAERCIGPIMIVNRVAARAGIDAIVFVAPKTVAGDDGRRSRCASWDGRFMRDWWSC